MGSADLTVDGHSVGLSKQVVQGQRRAPKPSRKLPGVSLAHPWWMFSHLHPHGAKSYQGRAIHPECLDRRLANSSQMQHDGGIDAPDKVLFPELVLGVQQGHRMPEQGTTAV